MNNTIELIEVYYNSYEWGFGIFCSLRGHYKGIDQNGYDIYEGKALEYISIKLLCFQIQIDLYYFRKNENKNKRSLFRFYK